jgi:hypothetical protein
MSRAMDRVKIAERSPHMCCRCGSPSEVRSYMIDIGVDYQYEGTMYLCNACCIDLVNLMPDAIKNSDVFEQQLELMSLRETVQVQRVQLDQSRSAYDRLNDRMRELDHGHAGDVDSESDRHESAPDDSVGTESESNPEPDPAQGILNLTLG